MTFHSSCRRADTQRCRAANPHRRLLCEPLEDRRMLSVGGPQVEVFGLSPAVFVENQGQWPEESVRLLHQGSGANVAMTDAGPVFQVFRRDVIDDAQEQPQEEPALGGFPYEPGDSFDPDECVAETLVFSASFVDANEVAPVGLERSETVFNYFIGDEANWRSEVPGYEVVAYEGLYDGVDLHTWGLRSSLKYEFHVDPGADWSQIAMRYDGIAGLSLSGDGSLSINLEDGWDSLIDAAPYIYQVIDGEEAEIAGRFVLLDERTYTIEITGEYDATQPLVIDPELAWSTYLGGSGNDWGRGIAVDVAGNALVAGSTTSTDFAGANNDAPTGPGQWPPYYVNNHVFVAKVSPEGQTLWATYLGGQSHEQCFGVAADAAGNALVTGWTRSSDFGGANNTIHSYQDAFVAKVCPEGTLQWATYLGGGGGEDIATDATGSALVTGRTGSPSFGMANNELHGVVDAFVAKVSPGGVLQWSTYLGGSDYDFAMGIAVDATGNSLVTGGTRSTDFAGANNTPKEGGSAFIAKVCWEGALQWSTYLGGSAGSGNVHLADYGYAIAVDAAGSALMTSGTYSTDFAGANNTSHGGRDAIVVKVSPDGALEWATYLGGSDHEAGGGIAIDTAGNVLVSGFTHSTDFAGVNNTKYGACDAFLAKISAVGVLQWATYFGGSGDDWGLGMAVDAAGDALVMGYTESPDFAGAINTFHGGWDAFVAKITVPAETGPITTGGVSVLNILIDFPDKRGWPRSREGILDPDLIGQKVTHDVGKETLDAVGKSLQNASWGQLWLETIDVAFGRDEYNKRDPLTMLNNRSYYADRGDAGWRALAEEAIVAAYGAQDDWQTNGSFEDDWDTFRSFTYRSFIVTFSAFDGMAETLGRGVTDGKLIWLNGTGAYQPVAAHEFGHNLGAGHSTWWKPSDGDPLSVSGRWYYQGDLFCVMGGVFRDDESWGGLNPFGMKWPHWPTDQFNTYWKHHFGWLPDANVHTLTEPVPGTYRVYAHDAYDGGAVPFVDDRIYSITLDTDRGTSYWLEYRQSIESGLQFRLSPGWGEYVAEVGAHKRDTLLFDPRGQATNPQDAWLPLHETYVSRALDLEITPVGAGIETDGNWWVEVEIVGRLHAALEDGTLTIEDVADLDNQLTVRYEDANLIVHDENARFITAPDGGWLSDDRHTLTMPLAVITELEIDLGGGTDVIDVGFLSSDFPSLRINGDGATDVVNFNDSVAFAPDHGLTVSDVGSVHLPTPSSSIAASEIFIEALRNVVLSPGSSITAEDGDIMLWANQQATPSEGGPFAGILVTGAEVRAAGTGSISLTGRGGSEGNWNPGVQICTGTIVSSGTGGVTITGVGGQSTGDGNHGVYVTGDGSRITSDGGAVDVHGTGGGADSSSWNFGVLVDDAGVISNSGTGESASVTVTGSGGDTAGEDNLGVLVTDSRSRIMSSGGNVEVIGTAGAVSGGESFGIQVKSLGQIGASAGTPSVTLAADSMDLASHLSVDAPDSAVLLRPCTAGTRIDVGGPDVLTGSPLTLGLTNQELNRIRAGVLRIGSSEAGPIEVTSAIELTGTETLRLISGGTVEDRSPGRLVVKNLAVESVGSTLLTGYETGDTHVHHKVETLAGRATGEGSSFIFHNEWDPGVGMVDGIDGVTANGDVVIKSHSPLTINAPVTTEGGGSIRLVATRGEGIDDHLTINAPVHVLKGEGSIELIAGTDVRISRGDTSPVSVVATGGGSIFIQADRRIEIDGVSIIAEGGGSIELTAGTDVLIDAGDHGDVEISVDGKGTLSITAGGYIELDSNVLVNSETEPVLVGTARLTVTVDDATKVYGEPNPPFSVHFDGFLLGQDASVLGGELEFETAADASSDVGTYTVSASGLTSEDTPLIYEITFVDGELTILQAPQTILWNDPEPILQGMPLSETQLNATVSVVGPAPAGELTYDPAAGTVLHAGFHTLTVMAAETLNYLPASATVEILVSGVSLVDGTLWIFGTQDDDWVHINGHRRNQVRVHTDFYLSGNHQSFSVAAIDRIVANLLDGDDHMTIAGNVTIPALIRGGSGDNFIHTAGGPAILIGGSGNDVLHGGAGRNILIGGAGSNTLRAGRSGDVLVGGSTNLDDDDDALFDLLADWNSSKSLENRTEQIIESLVVQDEEDEQNVFHGGAGHDLIFADLDDLLRGNQGRYTVWWL